MTRVQFCQPVGHQELLDRARILWSPCVADSSHWLAARIARGPPRGGRCVHLRSNLQGKTTSMPMLRTYAAHDMVAAAAASLAASTTQPAEGSRSPRLRPVPAPTIPWYETPNHIVASRL